MLKEIHKEIVEFKNQENAVPSSIAMSYLDGLDLLVEISKNTDIGLDEILDRGDRAEITDKLNNLVIYGMKVFICDLIIKGKE